MIEPKIKPAPVKPKEPQPQIKPKEWDVPKPLKSPQPRADDKY